MHTLTAALSGLALAASTVAAVPVSADPVNDCNFAPLKYTKNFSAGGEQFTTKASLRVYDAGVPTDTCTDATIVQTIAIKGRNNTSLASISPTRPRLSYKLNAGSTSYKSTGVQIDKTDPVNGWRTYDVTTDDIPLGAEVAYVMGIKLTWNVKVDGETFNRTVVCDRINADGSDAYTCKILTP
ncbi:hypothetical protein KRR39_19660 [Nocardioides panacis]|uniref:Cell wall protein n=1 Tax=Nocardioides panacis TaxID=2849501 RepID=A0A975XZP5_9ACTN|nr:hypothetical protein [Nocardioides panacis]QWZ07613.1 hypothetical protein KRR39_19660 [Nocardioides panacis]